MEITVEYSEKLMKAVTRRFLVRYFFGWKRSVALGIALLAALLLLSRGNRDWTFGVGVACLAILLIALPARHLVMYRRTISAYRKMPSHKATFTFTDEDWGTQTDLGVSRLQWRAIRKIWRFPDAWLIFITDWQYLTLPIAQVDETVRQFILANVEKHGGKVK